VNVNLEIRSLTNQLQ